MRVSPVTAASPAPVPATAPPTAVSRVLRGARLDPRAVAVLRAVDWTAARVVFWVPGTNEREMPPSIAQAFEAVMPDTLVVRTEYRQSWNMRESVPDGSQVLGDVLRGVALLRSRGITTPEVLVAGHSQGSWVIAEQMATAASAAVVSRAVLFSNPGTNPLRYPGPGSLTSGGPVGKVLEVSNPRDPIATPPASVDAALDVVAGTSTVQRVLGVLRLIITSPAYAARVGERQIKTFFNAYRPGEDPHLYAREAASALTFLRDGPRALASIGTGRDWRDYR